MTQHKDSGSKMSAGIIFGAIVGGLTAYFFSPRSGKENRAMLKKKVQDITTILEEGQVQDRVKEIYGDFSEQGKKAYSVAKKELDSRLKEVKEMVDDIDTEKYSAIIDDVMDRVHEETEESVDRIAKLKGYFMDRFHKAKTDVESDAKKVVKTVSKISK